MTGTFATQIGFLIFFIVIMYLLLIRPQKKKEKEIQAMRDALMVGDEIITIGGIRGKIIRTREETVIIQVGADKIKFELMRWGVSKVVESSVRPTSAGRAKPADDDDYDDEVVEAKKMPKKMKRAVSDDVGADSDVTDNVATTEMDEKDDR
jgi:preprotein translocase subunit YajC